MIVLFSVIIAFIMNVVFMIMEYRQAIWREGRFWVSLLGLGMVTGTLIAGM